MATIQIPEWALGSDKEIQIFLPLPWADYENVAVLIRRQQCPNVVEAKYAVNPITGYTSTGVSVKNLPHPDTGVLKDAVCVQIRRSKSKGFAEGIKYAEVLEIRTDVEWEDAEQHLIGRQYFASYYDNKIKQ